jgi:hypothetical protein
VVKIPEAVGGKHLANPEYIKAHHRYMKALETLDKHREAKEIAPEIRDFERFRKAYPARYWMLTGSTGSAQHSSTCPFASKPRLSGCMRTLNPFPLTSGRSTSKVGT